jgi:hypothetical protein
LDADDELPLGFPEVRGRPWPPTDWLVSYKWTNMEFVGKRFFEEEKKMAH